MQQECNMNCTKCQRDLPASEFGPSAPMWPDRRVCHECSRVAMSRKRHGLSIEDRILIAENQGGCAICGHTEPSAKGWVVDHDRISCCAGDKSCPKCRRGIICQWCNSLLGYAFDRIETLRGAIAYLEKHTASHDDCEWHTPITCAMNLCGKEPHKPKSDRISGRSRAPESYVRDETYETDKIPEGSIITTDRRRGGKDEMANSNPTNCPTCKHGNCENTTICNFCRYTLRDRLTNIPLLYLQAENCLQPGKTRNSTRSTEPPIGINVTALSWVKNLGYTVDKQPRSGLEQIYSWERLIREERGLTPAGLVPYAGTIEAEIAGITEFLKAHLEWIITRLWAPDFATEIADIHAGGMLAARAHEPHARRIDCPGDDEDGSLCGNRLQLDDDQPDAVIVCRRCNTHWTTTRLILVALNDQRTTTWLDADAIGEWLGLDPRTVAKFAQRHHIPSKGRRPALYDIAAFMAARKIEVAA